MEEDTESHSIESEIVDDIVLCEGSSNFPLTEDRASSLAVECWNLRKTILELNSEILKSRQESKSSKHLIKNLQRTLEYVKSEKASAAKEFQAVRAKLQESERKVKELNASCHSTNSILNKSKKSLGSSQSRLAEVEKEYNTFKLKW